MKVATQYIRPPIPMRSHDWMAFYPDLEGDADTGITSGPTGYGETEADALRDLAEQVADLWYEEHA